MQSVSSARRSLAAYEAMAMISTPGPVNSSFHPPMILLNAIRC
jgi:hypothetical protein